MYDPTLGRWIQQDPMGYVDGTNLYAYVGSRPVALRDPSGSTITIEMEVNQDWDDEADTWHYDISYYQRVKKALQDLIGDCAEIDLQFKYSSVGWGWSGSAFVAGNIFGGLYKGSSIVSATVGYMNEKKNCTCDKCWQRIKQAIDGGKRIFIHNDLLPNNRGPGANHDAAGGVVHVAEIPNGTALK